MRKPHPSRSALAIAAVVVIGALVALVIVELIVTARIQGLRNEAVQLTDPARKHLNEVNYVLSRQITSLSRWELTGDDRYLSAYRTAVSDQQRAMNALSAPMQALRGPCAAAFAGLQTAVRDWHAYVERTVRAPDRARTVPAAGEGGYDSGYASVIAAVYRLDEAIATRQAAQRVRAEKLTSIANWTGAALILLALVAMVTVFIMTSRLRSGLEREREAREMTESLVRSRDEILGIVSHDLRSPLTTIALSAQMIEVSPSEEQGEHLGTIQSAAKRMQRLIQDLLDATKLENSALSIRREIVDPQKIAQDVVASHAPIAAEKKIQLETSVDTPLPRISGDHDRLVQALSNLIGNALKFTPPEGTVRFVAQARDGAVRFTVSDSGPGIAAADLPHLFEPFWQAKKTAHLGAGLGLKITRAIVEAHGGTIRVSNVPPGGACFTFDIPAQGNESQ
jgi:signal transduction histidine kinase